MSDMKSVNFEDLLSKELENPEFKAEYEALEGEFTLANFGYTRNVIGMAGLRMVFGEEPASMRAKK